MSAYESDPRVTPHGAGYLVNHGDETRRVLPNESSSGWCVSTFGGRRVSGGHVTADAAIASLIGEPR